MSISVIDEINKSSPKMLFWARKKKKKKRALQGRDRIERMLLDWIIIRGLFESGLFSFPMSVCFNLNRTAVIVAVESHPSAFVVKSARGGNM